jgi:hypothetical protein
MKIKQPFLPIFSLPWILSVVLPKKLYRGRFGPLSRIKLSHESRFLLSASPCSCFCTVYLQAKPSSGMPLLLAHTPLV